MDSKEELSSFDFYMTELDFDMTDVSGRFAWKMKLFRLSKLFSKLLLKIDSFSSIMLMLGNSSFRYFL